MSRYEVIIYWSLEDKAFIAEVPELPGCMADGVTCYAQAVYTFGASDDAWVNELNPTANYGNNTYLSVKDRSGLAEAYIRFNQQDINSLTGKPIESAALFLYQYQGTNSPGDILNIHRVNTDWSELSVSWNARPSYDLAPVSFLNITGESNVAGWREWAGLENLVSGWGKWSEFRVSIRKSAG